MVLTAFRGSIRTVETLSVVGHIQATVPVASEQVLEEDLLIGETECADDVSPEIPSLVSNETVSQFSTFETAENLSFRFFEDEEPPYREHSEDTESANDHYEASLYSEKSLSQFDETDLRAEAESLTEISKDAEDFAAPEAGGILESAASSPVLNRDNQRDQEFEHDPVTGAVTADPWEEPLPAWDYSQNEWPVLIGPHKRTRIRQPRTAIAAFVILVVLAVFYLTVYRPANAERRATDNAIQAGAGERSASSAAGEEQKQTAQLSSDNDLRSTSEANETISQSVNENKNAQGKFSLQAAAFATDTGASEFAEKLKTAGLPSYVVSADVARRGRWFRVRVGRFNSADEAQRYAVEAQLRARSTGLALQLIVCQYEQP